MNQNYCHGVHMIADNDMITCTDDEQLLSMLSDSVNKESCITQTSGMKKFVLFILI